MMTTTKKKNGFKLSKHEPRFLSLKDQLSVWMTASGHLRMESGIWEAC